MAGELSREERDAFERLQVEAEELERVLAGSQDEHVREEANALKAEQLRDDLKESVRARDASLDELRDRVNWLEKSAQNPKRRDPASAISLLSVIFKVSLVGIGGAILFCVLMTKLVESYR